MEKTIDLNLLKQPLEYKWREQSIKFGTATCVAYIDARDVMDLLDRVCGPENWQSDYKDVKGNLFGGVGIKINGEWIWKWDCGSESNTEAEKGEASDSFKRAAVKWGVGRFLYDLGIVKLKVAKDKNGKERACKDDCTTILWDKFQITEYINKNKAAGVSSQFGDLSSPQQTQPDPEPETPAKPTLSEKGILQAVERIKKGEADLYDKLLNEFDLTDNQKNILRVAKTNKLAA